MEKAHNVVCADGAFEWDDLGSWSALARHIKADAEGNCAVGDFIHVDAARNIIYDARSKDRRTPIAVVGLREAGKIAADAGVTLAIEPLNRFETDLVNTSAQAVRLVDEVGSPAVKIHLDTFHMHIEEKSLLEAIRLAGPRLAHVHGCENDRGAPGTGLVAWAQVAQGLREVGYNGAVVIESFTPECKAIADAAAIWRPLAATQDALASEGLKFLRGLLR
jgi:D-psicose/D-tagatose/L-ribulose 3-epimerase